MRYLNLLLPLLIVETPAAPRSREKRAAKPAGKIELIFGDITVRLAANIDEAQLTRVVRALRAASE